MLFAGMSVSLCILQLVKSHCRGGTAGCALAARLVEDSNISVLLVEAGPTNEDVPASYVPAGSTSLSILIKEVKSDTFEE